MGEPSLVVTLAIQLSKFESVRVICTKKDTFKLGLNQDLSIKLQGIVTCSDRIARQLYEPTSPFLPKPR